MKLTIGVYGLLNLLRPRSGINQNGAECATRISLAGGTDGATKTFRSYFSGAAANSARTAIPEHQMVN